MSITAKDFVQAGIDYLNKREPSGWHEKIDLSTLDLGDGNKCVLAQVYGEYYGALSRLRMSEAKAEKLGFVFSDYATSEELTEEWKRRLKAGLKVIPDVDSIWQHRENSARFRRVEGGIVTVGGIDYWPLTAGYVNDEGEFQRGGDPFMMRATELHAHYKPYDPKPNFPVGSFLTDKKTKTHIFFVAPDGIVYRMSVTGTIMSYSQGLDFYLDTYGELIPVDNPVGNGPLVIKIAE